MSERCAPGPMLRHVRAQPTDDQRTQARASELYRLGDMVLVWVSEGDLYMPHVTPPATVAALVEALEAVSVLDLNARMPDDVSSSLEQAGITARAALALYREAGQ